MDYSSERSLKSIPVGLNVADTSFVADPGCIERLTSDRKRDGVSTSRCLIDNLAEVHEAWRETVAVKLYDAHPQERLSK